MKGWKMAAAAVVLCSTLAWSRPAAAESSYENAGWGVLTVLTNVVYMPAKVVYATLGGVTGGLALGLTGGDMQVAENVWTASLGGTYVITPRMLRGEDRRCGLDRHSPRRCLWPLGDGTVWWGHRGSGPERCRFSGDADKRVEPAGT